MPSSGLFWPYFAIFHGFRPLFFYINCPILRGKGRQQIDRMHIMLENIVGVWCRCSIDGWRDRFVDG